MPEATPENLQRLEKKIQEMEKQLHSLTAAKAGDETADLIRLGPLWVPIHRPGWTSILQIHSVERLVDSMHHQLQAFGATREAALLQATAPHEADGRA